MSKELEAFRIMVKDNGLELPYHNTIIAVETALKRLEEHDKTELSALIENHKKLIKEKEKQDEILQIIKECPDELKWVDFCDEFDTYKLITGCHRKYTQDEFELLKGWINGKN